MHADPRGEYWVLHLENFGAPRTAVMRTRSDAVLQAAVISSLDSK